MSATQALIIDLESALKNGSADRRSEILRRVADLFLGRCNAYSEEEIALFETVILRLICHIERQAIAELSRRLAPVASAPIAVVGQLARDDDIEISGPVLEESERLTDDDLIEIASSKSQDHLLKIAGRARLNEAVTDVLVDRGDSEVANEVASNVGARLSHSAFSKLVMWADGDERLAAVVAERPDLPPHLVRQLLVRATDDVRERLLAIMEPEGRDEVRKIVSEITGRINKAVTPRYYSQAKLLVRSYSQDAVQTSRKLLELAQAWRLGESIAALSALSGLSVDLVDRLIHDPGHYGIMVLCRSIGLDWRTAHAVMTMPRMGVEARSLVLEAVYEEYEALSGASAQRLIRFWQVRQMNPGADGNQRPGDVVPVRRAGSILPDADQESR